MMSHVYLEIDDLRQSFIVAKNEMIKSFRGRKFMASLVLILLVFGLITMVPFITGKGWGAEGQLGTMLSSYLSYVSMFAVLVVGLIGSVAIVSEYEERTALILFTRPIKKTSVFVGKFIAAFAVGVILMMVYYIGVTIMTTIYYGTVSTNMLQSLCMCILYLFAATGISFIFSSILKKSSVCIIFSILALIVVIPVISTMIAGDTWFMLDSAGNSILTCIPEYVDAYNAGVNSMMDSLNTIYQTLIDTEQYDLANGVKRIIAMMSAFVFPIEYPTLWKEAAVMLTWGAVSLVIAWIAFLRREF